jgi:hypothetical protein
MSDDDINLRDTLARIDRQLIAEAGKLERDLSLMPWQVGATLLGAGAAIFAAGAGFFKLFGS